MNVHIYICIHALTWHRLCAYHNTKRYFLRGTWVWISVDNVGTFFYYFNIFIFFPGHVNLHDMNKKTHFPLDEQSNIFWMTSIRSMGSQTEVLANSFLKWGLFVFSFHLHMVERVEFLFLKIVSIVLLYRSINLIIVIFKSKTF